MIQRMHPMTGEVCPCKCGKQPHAYSVGHHLWMLECSPCGVRTAKRASLQEALEDWSASELLNTVRAAA